MKRILIISVIFILVSCQQKSRIQTYPNKMSEMALSMRSMVDQLNNAKDDINSGLKAHLSIEDFKDYIFTDDSFENEGFNPMADAFLLATKRFNEDPSAYNYNLVVNSCRSCHMTMCSGPLELINTLDID